MEKEIFFIFSQYRTGSTVLCDALNSHPEIICVHESLRPGEIIDPPGRCATVRYQDVAVILSEMKPDARFIGLHGQYDHLDEIMHLADELKIRLFRRDTVGGAIGQCLLNYTRVNAAFDLNVDIALDCNKLRIKRDKEMCAYTDYDVKTEKIFRNNEMIEKIPRRLSRRLLKRIGVDDFRRPLIVSTNQHRDEFMPANREEIYARAR